MNKFIKENFANKLVWSFAMILGMLAFSSNASAQLINEILVNPNGGDSNCEFVEIIGDANGALTNVYFASIEGDGTSTVGAFDRVVDLSASTLGTNGLLVITNDAAGDCVRTYNSPPTTRVQVTNFSMENGTTSWALILSPTTAIVEGTDYDSDNDGTLDALPGDATILDGIGWTDGGKGDVTFGAFLGPTTFGAPDMATRFPSNTDANSAAAWYYGDMDGENTSLMYDLTQVSANFPQDGILTPGDTNAGAPLAPGDANVDFDGDGRSDFVVTRPNGVTATGNSQLRWFIMNNGSGALSGADLGLQTDRRIPSDYDGDGKDDIAVWRPNNGNGATFYILNSSDGTLRIDNFGLLGDDPKVVADYDGDGADDVAVYRQNAGGQNFFFYRGSAGNGDITFIPWGSGEFVRPNVGDYDGDGLADFLVYNQSGLFSLLRSSNGQVEYTNWGIGSEALAPGDYDGDGVDDYVVVRNDGGQRNWYLLQSTDVSRGGTGPIPFGLPSDRLTPGDYDGDRKEDIAVWRPSEGLFYILNSSDGSVSFVKWGTDGDDPEANWKIHQAGVN